MSTPPHLDVPAGVRRIEVATRRGALAALTATPHEKSDKSAVVLVPGITGSKEDFIAVVAPIAAAGHHVTALDQRGQFESRGDDDPTTYDVAALAEEILDVAGSLGSPVHLVGHSFGGLVARAAALASPASVRSLTLLDSGPGAVPHPSASNLALLVQVLPVMDMASIWAAKRQLEVANEPVPPSPAVEEWMRRRFLANHPTSLLRIAEQLLSEPDRVDELAALDLPVLVAYGEKEDAWPPALQADMAARLRAAHVEIAGAGHSPAADKPEVTVQVLVHFWAMVESAT
ncbi:MAG: alpha/beta fold hydrolase [Actinomycetes bacterium]